MKNLLLKLILAVAIVLGFGSLAMAEEPTSTQLKEFNELVEQVRAGKIDKFKLETILQQNRTKELYSDKVVVDYNLTLDQMISAARYNADNVSKEIVKHFSISGQGKVKRELVRVYLGYLASTGQVLGELDKLGLEPAKIEDLLALTREMIPSDVVVALGSSWQDPEDGSRYFAAFEFASFQKWLGVAKVPIGFVGDGWKASCSFLAVRK